MADQIAIAYVSLLFCVNLFVFIWGIIFIAGLPAEWRKDFPKEKTDG